VRWAIHPGESPLFGDERGCAEFEQRLLRFSEASGEHVNPLQDEVLYVLSGTGSARILDDEFALAPGTAAYVARGTAWRVAEADGLELLSVLVNDPVDADGTTHSIVTGAAVEVADATAGRMFRLLATPDVGCATVTQFLGYIPVGRAPDHFHRYDEVIYVLQGEGALHVDGESAPLRPGTCVHLPSQLVHCLENTGPGEMQVLGVFRPAGSPAEAYYPDGTRALY
jgi:mannose-6-phosphate isomerase-like protein (cupin superfamily)